MLAHLDSSHNDRFNKYFPSDLQFYHKTGRISGSKITDVSVDAGWFETDDDQVVIIVGVQNFDDLKPLQQIGQFVLSLINP